MIEKMRVHFEASDFTQNFKARIIFRGSVSGKLWSTDNTLLDWQTTNGQVIGAWVTDDTKFDINLRAMLEIGNATGTDDEIGRITAILVVVFRS